MILKIRSANTVHFRDHIKVKGFSTGCRFALNVH